MRHFITLVLAIALLFGAGPLAARPTKHAISATQAELVTTDADTHLLYSHVLEDGKWNVVDIYVSGVSGKSVLHFHQRAVLCRVDPKGPWALVGDQPSVSASDGSWIVVAQPEGNFLTVKVRGLKQTSIAWEAVALATAIHTKAAP